MIKNILLILGILSLTACMQKNSLCNYKTSYLNDKKNTIEHACSTEEITTGLMNRDSIPENHGMLFIFPFNQALEFWMKNTRVPLDIAYIDENFVIKQIEQMKPYDLTPVVSKYKVLYALEMNVGWFAKNNIKVGDTLKFVPLAN